jgi:hypothetical protein
LYKQAPESVFGIIKSALGFHQISPRRLENARGERSLVTTAWNLKRMFVLTPPDEGAALLARDAPR